MQKEFEFSSFTSTITQSFEKGESMSLLVDKTVREQQQAFLAALENYENSQQPEKANFEIIQEFKNIIEQEKDIVQKLSKNFVFGKLVNFVVRLDIDHPDVKELLNESKLQIITKIVNYIKFILLHKENEEHVGMGVDFLTNLIKKEKDFSFLNDIFGKTNKFLRILNDGPSLKISQEKKSSKDKKVKEETNDSFPFEDFEVSFDGVKSLCQWNRAALEAPSSTETTNVAPPAKKSIKPVRSSKSKVVEEKKVKFNVTKFFEIANKSVACGSVNIEHFIRNADPFEHAIAEVDEKIKTMAEVCGAAVVETLEKLKTNMLENKKQSFCGFNRAGIYTLTYFYCKSFNYTFHTENSMIQIPDKAKLQFAKIYNINSSKMKFTSGFYDLSVVKDAISNIFNVSKFNGFIDKITQTLNAYPAYGNKKVFDRILLFVPSIEFAEDGIPSHINYNGIDKICDKILKKESYPSDTKNIQFALDMAMIITGSTLGVVCGERDGKTYFVSYLTD